MKELKKCENEVLSWRKVLFCKCGGGGIGNLFMMIFLHLQVEVWRVGHWQLEHIMLFPGTSICSYILFNPYFKYKCWYEIFRFTVIAIHRGWNKNSHLNTLQVLFVKRKWIAKNFNYVFKLISRPLWIHIKSTASKLALLQKR